MTDQMNLDNAPLPKPAIGKTTPPTDNDTPAPVDSLAETVSRGREALLGVDTYAEAETLLTENPDLIEQARAVFGTIVPTSGQNRFVDLAIKAAADDDPTDLRGALQTKRTEQLNLTGPEVSQLLEFSTEQSGKTPVLALSVALLLTDDLTRLEDAGLWQTQKDIVLKLEKTLNLDAAALWEDVSREEVKPAPPPQPAPKVQPVKAAVIAPEKTRPAPPPPPAANKPQKNNGSGLPRWLLATGFIFLISMFSCGACALVNLF